MCNVISWPVSKVLGAVSRLPEAALLFTNIHTVCALQRFEAFLHRELFWL